GSSRCASSTTRTTRRRRSCSSAANRSWAWAISSASKPRGTAPRALRDAARSAGPVRLVPVYGRSGRRADQGHRLRHDFKTLTGLHTCVGRQQKSGNRGVRVRAYRHGYLDLADEDGNVVNKSGADLVIDWPQVESH